MHIAISNLSLTIGNFEKNQEKIIQAIIEAKQQHADLILFPALTLTGPMAKDLLKNDAFLKKCQKSLKEISSYCSGIHCLIGTPIQADIQSEKLYNAIVHIENGEIKGFYPKKTLKNEDLFDEHRYFKESRKEGSCFINNFSVNIHFESETALKKANTDFHLIFDYAPFSVEHTKTRKERLKEVSATTKTPILYINHLGAYTDVLFDGKILAFGTQDDRVIESEGFTEGIRFLDFDGFHFTAVKVPKEPLNDSDKIAHIHRALIFGLREYFRQNNFQKALLGLSGGLDSALVAALACEALAPENVLCVLMPSDYSPDHSIQDAEDLVKNTGCASLTIPIRDIFEGFNSLLAPSFEGYGRDVTEENLQARSRGVILMALSNKFGHVVLNTSNKSESAVGYGTLYGDMAGALAVIADVYKSDAYKLAEYLNREREIIPINTIIKPPSAELRPDQQDSDSLPPYDILDDILYHLIELEKSTEWLLKNQYPEDIVKRISHLLAGAEYKRHQAAPVLRVSQKSFGEGRKIPLTGQKIF